jgi:hypothetical protein
MPRRIAAIRRWKRRRRFEFEEAKTSAQAERVSVEVEWDVECRSERQPSPLRPERRVM